MSLDPSDECACPHCNNNIEFDVNAAGSEISCPHCGERLTLPGFKDKETGSLSAQITENVFVCPNCRRASVTFDRDASGKEWTCFECDHTTSIPEFSDDPAVARDRYEDQFLNREGDWVIVGASGYHEGDPSITLDFVDGSWGLVGCLGFILLIVTFFAVDLLPDEIMDREKRQVVTTAALFTLVAIVAALIIRAQIYAHRVKQFGDLQFVSPIDNQMLEMGDDLRGRISLNLNKPLPHGSLGLSLSLVNEVVTETMGEHGVRRTVKYRVLNRNALLVVQGVNFLSDDELTFEFTISTPQHKEVEQPGFLQQILGEEHTLKWRLTAELMGPLGVALQRKMYLSVL